MPKEDRRRQKYFLSLKVSLIPWHQNRNDETDFLLEISSLAFRSVRSFFTGYLWMEQIKMDSDQNYSIIP